MKMLATLLIAAGISAVIWGLPAAFRFKRPFDLLAALATLVGIATALLGVLLLAVPGFFEG